MLQTIQTANATLQIKSMEEVPFGEVPGELKLSKGSFVLAYAGDLQGEGILEELKVHFNAKNAVMQGLQRFTGKLDDKSGSFVLQHEGRFVNGVVSSKMTVVPTSGTDGLKGLRGRMKLQSVSAESFAVTFTYHFA